MKNKNLFVTILLISSLAIGQSSPNNRQTKSNEITNNVKADDTVKVDFIKGSAILPIDTKENAKLIMVRETGEADYWKYIIPVFTLILGIFLNKLLDYFSSRREIKRSGKTWIAELIGLEDSLHSQKEALENFSETFSENNYEIPTLKIFGGLDGKNFEPLEKKDLLKYIEIRYGTWEPSILINNDKENTDFKKYVKAANKITGYIDIVKFNFIMITEKHSSYLNGISMNTSVLNKQLHGFRDEIAQYNIEIKRETGFDAGRDQRLNDINAIFKREIMDKMANGENINPLELPASFCQPILAILAVTSDDVRTYSLRTFCTALLNTVEAIKAEREYMKTNLQTIIGRFEESIKDLPEVISLLNAKKLPD